MREPKGLPSPLPYVGKGPDYSPGKTGVGTAGLPLWRLSSNESPLGMSPKAQQAIIDAAGHQHLYPDADGTPLAEAIAAQSGLDSRRILAAPGSDSIINWIIRGWAAPGDEIVYSSHGFQSYRIRAATAGVTAIAAPEQDLTADIPSLLQAVTAKTKVMFLANPNNPTGTYLTPQALERLRTQLRQDVMLVVDEAYFDYVRQPDYASALSLAEDFPDNVIVTRTFSKFYALAGLRVGWAYAPSSAMAPLARMRGPFSVSSAAIAAAIAALGDETHAKASLEHNEIWQPWLSKRLQALGFQTSAGVGNFVLMHVQGGPEAARHLDGALRAAGYSARLADQNALPDWMRITVGTQEANEGLVRQLERFSTTYRHFAK